MKSVLLGFSMLFSSILFASGSGIEEPWFTGILKNILGHFPELNMWFASVMVFLMTALRALSELLFFISRKTETTADDDIAQLVAKALNFVATVVGWFGLGSTRK